MTPIRRAFTLLELLIVITILAALAGSVLASMAGSHADAMDEIHSLRVEELRKALLRFRADTGFFPGEGPFRAGAGVVAPPDLAPTFADAAQWEQWFSSPANLLMLIKAPAKASAPTAGDPYAWALSGSAESLSEWHPERKRGWKGPYLRAAALAWVQVSSDLSGSGAGDPAAASLLPPMPALSDGRAHPAAASTEAFAWWTPSGELLQTPQGHPLYLFNMDSSLPGSFARIVSEGPDADYQAHALPALSASPTGPPPAAPNSDDLGLFLVR